jgi:hypothetical protein
LRKLSQSGRCAGHAGPRSSALRSVGVGDGFDLSQTDAVSCCQHAASLLTYDVFRRRWCWRGVSKRPKDVIHCRAHFLATRPFLELEQKLASCGSLETVVLVSGRR